MCFPKLRFSCVFLCLLVCTSRIGTAAEPNDATSREDHAKLVALVDFLDSELDIATNLMKQQAASKAEVDAIHADLAMARHDLAVAENDTDEIHRQCQQLINIRGRQLQRELDIAKMGFGSKLKRSTAKRRLAFAHHVLAQVDDREEDALRYLKLVVRYCNDELEQLQKLQAEEAVSPVALNRMRYRMTVAEYHLAKAEGNSRSVLPKLRTSVDECNHELDQITQLHRQGYADIIDQHFAAIHFFNAKLLLASLEQDNTVVQEVIDQLIETHEQTLPRLGNKRKGRVARLIIEQALELDRKRKIQFQRDGYLEDDLSTSVLGV